MSDAPPSESESKHRPSTLARIAAQFSRDATPPLPTRITAELRRMDPERFSPALGALIPVLLRAGIRTDTIGEDRLRRWAVIVHIVAILAGTSGRRVHSPDVATGRVIHDADFKELRFMRLMTARGPALMDQVVRLARFLAAREVLPIDLRPLATLVLCEGIDEEKAEQARLELARFYYAAEAASENQTPEITTDTD